MALVLRCCLSLEYLSALQGIRTKCKVRGNKRFMGSLKGFVDEKSIASCHVLQLGVLFGGGFIQQTLDDS